MVTTSINLAGCAAFFLLFAAGQPDDVATLGGATGLKAIVAEAGSDWETKTKQETVKILEDLKREPHPGRAVEEFKKAMGPNCMDVVRLHEVLDILEDDYK